MMFLFMVPFISISIVAILILGFQTYKEYKNDDEFSVMCCLFLIFLYITIIIICFEAVSK